MRRLRDPKTRAPQARTPKAAPACQCCGTTDEVEVTPDTELCPECQSEHYVYCSVCADWQSRDGGCRHLSWTDCGYTGAGATDGLDPAETHKEGVFAFFDLLDTLVCFDGDNMARAAARAIRRDRFVTQMRGFMLSTPDLYLKERRFFDHGEETWCDFGEVRARDLKGFDQALLGTGFDWLSTLDDDTAAANRLTTRWANEWKRDRDAGSRPLPGGKTRVPYLSPLPTRHREPKVPSVWKVRRDKKRRSE